MFHVSATLAQQLSYFYEILRVVEPFQIMDNANKKGHKNEMSLTIH